MDNLEYFMATALDANLKYWEEPQRVFRTPTEGHDSPHSRAREESVQRDVEPPGLPTLKAGPTFPQEFMQHGVALSSRIAAGCTEFYRLDSGQGGVQYAGGNRQVLREAANLGERNLLEGRTGARAEYNAQTSSHLSTSQAERGSIRGP